MFCCLCFVKLSENAGIGIFSNRIDRNLIKLLIDYLELDIDNNNDEQLISICLVCRNQFENFYEFCQHVRQRQKWQLGMQANYHKALGGGYTDRNHEFVNCDYEEVEIKLDAQEEILVDDVLTTNEEICDGEVIYEDVEFLDEDYSIVIRNKEVSSSVIRAKMECRPTVLRHAPAVNIQQDSIVLMHTDTKSKAQENTTNIVNLVINENSRNDASTDNNADVLDNDCNNESNVRLLQAEALKLVHAFDNTNNRRALLRTDDTDSFIRKHIKLECAKCDVVKNTFNELKQHFKLKHDDPKGYIACCDKRFYERYNLLDHIKFHVDPDSFKCKICGKLMTTTYGFAYHMENKHTPEEDRKYICPVCGKKHANLSIFKVHLQIHEVKNGFKCDRCDKNLKSRRSHREHMLRVHADNYKFVCEKCGLKFKHHVSFKNHMYEHEHGKKPQPDIPCKICGRYFTKFGMPGHMEVHNTTDVKCKYCGKIMGTKASLRSHMGHAHRYQPIHKCPFCEKRFKGKREYKDHLNTHTGAKDLTCPFCPHKSSNYLNRYSHIRRHHREEQLKRREMRLRLPHVYKPEV